MSEASRNPALDSLEAAPYARALGLKVRSASDGRAVATMKFKLGLLNDGGPTAPIHGGAIASLADFAACAAVWSMADTRRSATISITVNYSAPAVTTDLVAHAMVRSKGRRVASIAVEVRDDALTVVADALVTYKIA